MCADVSGHRRVKKSGPRSRREDLTIVGPVPTSVGGTYVRLQHAGAPMGTGTRASGRKPVNPVLVGLGADLRSTQCRCAPRCRCVRAQIGHPASAGGIRGRGPKSVCSPPKPTALGAPHVPTGRLSIWRSAADFFLVRATPFRLQTHAPASAPSGLHQHPLPARAAGGAIPSFRAVASVDPLSPPRDPPRGSQRAGRDASCHSERATT